MLASLVSRIRTFLFFVFLLMLPLHIANIGRWSLESSIISPHSYFNSISFVNILSIMVAAVGETGASCYNFHSKSLFHKICQLNIFLGRDRVI